METVDIGQKLVELGFARASVPQGIKKNTIESEIAPVILSAEAKAKTFRNGIWSDQLGPVPMYVTYWRKGTQLSGELLLLTAKKLLQALGFASKSAYAGVKYLALRPFRPAPKVQAT